MCRHEASLYAEVVIKTVISEGFALCKTLALFDCIKPFNLEEKKQGKFCLILQIYNRNTAVRAGVPHTWNCPVHIFKTSQSS